MADFEVQYFSIERTRSSGRIHDLDEIIQSVVICSIVCAFACTLQQTHGLSRSPFVPGISSSCSSSPSRLLSAYMSALLGLPLSTRHRASFWPFTGCVPMDKGRKLHWNEPENMLKHPSTKPAICNLLLGIVRHCSTRSYSALALSLSFFFFYFVSLVLFS